MEWCNCYYDSSFLGSIHVDINSNESPQCQYCGKKITKEDIVMLLLKETQELKIKVEDLQLEKETRERIKQEEEWEKDTKDAKVMENIDKAIERFNILDI